MNALYFTTLGFCLGIASLIGWYFLLYDDGIHPGENILQADALLDVNLKLRKENRAKDEFLARVSHDFRTPLITILGYGDILARDVRLTRCDGALGAIYRNATHLLSLIDELQEFARDKIDANLLRPAPLYLHALIEHVSQQVEILAQESGNRMQVTQRGDLPKVVVLDPVRIRQVLFNLLANAAKFSCKGVVTLRVRAEAGASPYSQSLIFEVIDTGIGIDPSQHERIFEPFCRAIGAGIGIPGSGLGLAICRQWARAMGGDIAVQSVLGEGSCFTFRLDCPLADETDVDPVDAVLFKPVDSSVVPKALAHLLRLPATGMAELCSAFADVDQGDLSATMPGNIALPGTEKLQEFLTCAELGAVSRLESRAMLLRQEYPEYAQFADFIMEHASVLDVEGIAAYCAAAIDACP